MVPKARTARGTFIVVKKAKGVMPKKLKPEQAIRSDGNRTVKPAKPILAVSDAKTSIAK
jgi:hypothetical protein